MIDITKILQYAPAGTILYSPIFGNVEFIELIEPTERSSFAIKTKLDNRFIYFTKEGRYSDGVGECMLFPSEDMRTWEGVTYEPPREDLAEGTPVVTFVTTPEVPSELVILYYAKNGKCFITGRSGSTVPSPHAIPVDRFDFESLTWDTNDDYGSNCDSKNEEFNLIDYLTQYLNNEIKNREGIHDRPYTSTR